MYSRTKEMLKNRIITSSLRSHQWGTESGASTMCWETTTVVVTEKWGSKNTCAIQMASQDFVIQHIDKVGKGTRRTGAVGGGPLAYEKVKERKLRIS